ncbi:MAG: alpha/beta hydrolase [Acidobacteria bacterium]|nr:alpha/beta hydrolase [Acidobacteriota bacterium]
MRDTRFVAASSLALILLVVLAVIWFGQRSLMYFPSSDLPAPADVGLPGAEAVEFRTEDGLDLAGWFVEPAGPPSGYTVLVCHGNAGNRGHRAPLAARLSRLGAAVLLFDYRGYGGNPGLPFEAGLARDARAALRYLKERTDVDPRRIVFFGESLGTGVAVRLAAEDPPAALILRSPFTSFVEVAAHHYPFLPARWLLRDRFASIDRIAKIVSPTLVIAGDADEIVPLADSEALFARVPAPKRLVIVRDAGHNDDVLMWGPQVIGAIADWLGLQSSAPPATGHDQRES